MILRLKPSDCFLQFLFGFFLCFLLSEQKGGDLRFFCEKHHHLKPCLRIFGGSGSRCVGVISSPSSRSLLIITVRPSFLALL